MERKEKEVRQRYRYIGCFVSKEELFQNTDRIGTNRLAKIIEYPHVTFLYKPETVDESLFGKKVRITVTGYGNDGENEGLKVSLYSEVSQIMEMAEQIGVPHITLSIGDGAAAVNTGFLNFHEIEHFQLEGIFGGFCEEGFPVLEPCRIQK